MEWQFAGCVLDFAEFEFEILTGGAIGQMRFDLFHFVIRHPDISTVQIVRQRTYNCSTFHTVFLSCPFIFFLSLSSSFLSSSLFFWSTDLSAAFEPCAAEISRCRR